VHRGSTHSTTGSNRMQCSLPSKKLIQSGAAAGEVKGMHSPNDRVLHSRVRISFGLEPAILHASRVER